MKELPNLMASAMSTAISKSSGRMKEDMSSGSKKKSSKMSKKDFLRNILAQRSSKLKKIKTKTKYGSKNISK